MTPEEFQKRLTDKIAKLEVSELVYPVATKVHADMVGRLFDDGKDGKNTDLGTYDTKPAYFSKDEFKRKGSFKARGKNSDKPFANGKQRSSMYFSDGYKGLKAAQGYESGFVNLQYSSDLRNDFASKLTATEEGAEARVSRRINQQKVKWLTDKYGRNTFKLNEQERKFFQQETTKRLLNYLNA